MLRGHIDALTSSGYIEGWAFDTTAPENPLSVSIIDSEGSTITSGFAYLYRQDLAAAGCGIGWCFFRLKVESVTRVRKTSLTLVEDISKSVIVEVDAVNYIETGEVEIASVSDLGVGDPTMISSIEQLSGCEALFKDFILARGVEAFVRTAYVYVLGRSADHGGLKRYTRLLRQGSLTPFALLQTLADSDEFRSRTRLLGAPNAASFPLVFK